MWFCWSLSWFGDSCFCCCCCWCCFVCCSERVLGVVNSEGLHDPGPVRWPLALCLLAAWVLIFLCMLKGIRSSGKVSEQSVNVVCTHTTSCALPRPAGRPSLLSQVCLYDCCVLSGGVCHGYLPVLCAYRPNHQRSNSWGLPSGCHLLPHSGLGSLIQRTGADNELRRMRSL